MNVDKSDNSPTYKNLQYCQSTVLVIVHHKIIKIENYFIQILHLH